MDRGLSGTKNKETELQQAEVRITRWPYLTVGVIMMLFAGIIYAWSILKAPLAAEFGWDSAQLGLNFTITMGCFCFGSILGGMITKKLSPKIIVILFSIVIFIGFFGSSRLTGELGMLYLFYGGLAGIGIGVTYNIVISSVTKWFPDKRATASGALLMGFGASSLVLGSIMSGLINTSGWRNAYFVLGLILLIVLLIGAFFLRPPDARVAALVTEREKKGSAGEAGKDYTAGQMIRKPSFWKSYILLMLLASVGSGVISLVRDVSLSVGMTETLAVTLVGVLSVCNGFGRIITGFLYDSIGRKLTMLIAGGIAILASAVMLAAVWMGAAPLLIVGVVLVGVSYGTCPTITSGVAGSFFGTKHFPLNFSIYTTLLFPASFAATIAGIIVKSTGSYVLFFIMLLGFTLVALILNLSLKRAREAGK